MDSDCGFLLRSARTEQKSHFLLCNPAFDVYILSPGTDKRRLHKIPDSVNSVVTIPHHHGSGNEGKWVIRNKTAFSASLSAHKKPGSRLFSKLPGEWSIGDSNS